MRKWRIEDSEELYNVTGWGTSYFGINDKGHVVVTPRKDGVAVDLKELVDELQLRDVAAPVLVRFPDILDNRIEKTSSCFRQAAEEYGYKAQNFIITRQFCQCIPEIIGQLLLQFLLEKVSECPDFIPFHRKFRIICHKNNHCIQMQFTHTAGNVHAAAFIHVDVQEHNVILR